MCAPGGVLSLDTMDELPVVRADDTIVLRESPSRSLRVTLLHRVGTMVCQRSVVGTHPVPGWQRQHYAAGRLRGRRRPVDRRRSCADHCQRRRLARATVESVCRASKRLAATGRLQLDYLSAPGDNATDLWSDVCAERGYEVGARPAHPHLQLAVRRPNRRGDLLSGDVRSPAVSIQRTDARR